MCFSKYSTRIVAKVAEVDKFARNEFATIYKWHTDIVKMK